MNGFARLSDSMKGLLLIIAGTILLLHTLGLVTKSLNLIIIIGSIAMIVIGISLTGYHKKIMKLLEKKQQPPFKQQ